MALVIFILGLIGALIGMVALFIVSSEGKIFSLIPIIVGIALILFSSLYTQDVGDVVVLRNIGGSIEGTSTEAGFHIRAPWQDTIRYDIRNNVLSFMGSEEEDQFEGGSANGSAVTINDAGGAKASIDIQVNYSLNPEAAEQLYADYGTQENFVKSVCAVDIRAIPRQVSGQFDTISILTAREEFATAVQDALSKKWEEYGLVVEQVSIQNVVYPDSVVDAYAAAQSAEIAKAQAQNEQETAKVKMETKVIEAQKTAEANEILAKSLSKEVLTQKYIDTLASIGANGNLVVVPENSTPFVNIEKISNTK